MPLVAGITYRYEIGVQYLETLEGNLEKGMAVVAQSPHGPKLAQIVIPPQLQKEVNPKLSEFQILRAATSEDLDRAKENQTFEEEALQYALRRGAAQSLPMKMIIAECSLDGRHLTIYFTAPQRIDFRVLVRELAARFHMRIRLTQVGERDEARLHGGVGPCGQLLCCKCFLTSFDPVSIQAAKLQDLPLNSSRLGGLCGKLKCCLNFEKDIYEEAEEYMPGLGARVVCPCGGGLVVERNIPKSTVLISLDDTGETHECPVRECQQGTDPRK